MTIHAKPLSGSLSALSYVILALFSLLAFAPGIATLPPTDRDESRFVQASKQMVESGDFIDLRFQDEPRYKKPAGIYWLQSAAVLLYGEGTETPIWVYRTVSVAAGIAAVLATAWLGARMFGPAAGMAAGFGLAGILMLGFEARIAKTDAALLAVTIAAQAALAHIYLSAREGGQTRLAPWVFWTAQGLGILVKGPIVAAVSILTIVFVAWFDRDRAWLRRLRAGWGIPLALLIAAPWLALITWKSGGAFWQEAVGQDLLGKVASGQESHGAPPGYFFVLYSATFWPYGVAGMIACLAALRRLSDPRLLFCIAWFLPFWVAIELVPTKLPHYILPVYPAIMLAVAWAVTNLDAAADVRTGWRLWLYRAALLGAVVATLALAVVATGVSPFVIGTFSWWGLLASILLLAAGWLGSGIWPPLEARVRIPAASAASAAAFGILTSTVVPSLQPVWLSPQIAAAFESVKPCEDSRLVAAGYHEPSLVFLVGTDTMLTNGRLASRQLRRDKCAVALISDDQLETFKAGIANSPGIVELDAVEGINYSKGTSRRLALYANAN
jgi:4-amino-4-deoxy-L-arabinose transferase-like glycosyltransferase